MGPELLLLLFVPAIFGKKKSSARRGWWDDCAFEDYSPKVAERIKKYAGYMYDAAEEWSIDPDILAGLVTTESNWRPTAHSHVGAMGMTQVMPSTAKKRSEQTGIPNNPWDPKTNLRLGAAGIATYVDRWGSYDHALASYFAGSGNVAIYRETDQWPEHVIRYVNAVKRNARKFRDQRLKC